MIGLLGVFMVVAAGASQDDARALEFGKEYANKVTLRNGEYMYVTYTFTDEANVTRLPFDVCKRKCEGGKHQKHENCDASCDTPCNPRGKHANHVPTTFIPRNDDGAVMSQEAYVRKMDNVLTKERLPFRAEAVFGNISQVIHGGGFTDLRGVSYEKDCWNTQHCSFSQGWAEARELSLTVRYQFASDPDWGGPAPEEMGGSGSLRFFVVVPTGKSYGADRPTPACRCEPPTPPDPPKETGMIPGGSYGDGEYAYVEQGGKKRVITGTELASVVKTVVCNDMNTAVLTVAAMPDAKVVVPAGWELECIEGGGQNVQLQEDLEVLMTAEEQTLLLSLNPARRPVDVQKTLWTLCLEIDAPEPRPGMKYRLVPPQNPILSRLARITRRSSFKGPLDQIRLWIATDFASHEKISKVLIPAPREAQYLKEAHRAAEVNALNPFDPRALLLLENKFLLAEGGDPVAVRWCVGVKLRAGDKAMLQWLQSQRELVAKLFSDDRPESDVAQIGAICGTLAATGRLDAIKAAIGLARAVPAQHQALFGKSYGVLQIVQVLGFTSDAGVATEILDWLEAEKPAFAIGAQLPIHPSLPNSIKNRAKALVTVKKAA